MIPADPIADAIDRLARHYGRDGHERNDMAQTGWLAVLRLGPTDFDHATGAARTAMHHAIRGEMRRLARERVYCERRALHHEHCPGDRLDVPGLVATLSPKRRAVIELLLWEGMSPNEIADQTGLAVTTVRSHWRNALIQLREIYR